MELRKLVRCELPKVNNVLDGGLIRPPECEHGIHKLAEAQGLTILE